MNFESQKSVVDAILNCKISNSLDFAERRPFGCLVCLIDINLLRRQHSGCNGGSGPSSYGSFRYAVN